MGSASVRLMAVLDCWALRRVLLEMARRFPRTLEAFLCGGLSPAAAELLTARFETADARLAEQGAQRISPSCFWHSATLSDACGDAVT